MRQRGIALIDLIVSLGVISVLAGMAIPVMQRTRERDEVRTAARFFTSRLQQARLEAIRRNTAVAVRFEPADANRFRVFVDGDGDGLLETDISRGIDLPLGPEERLTDYANGIAPRINQSVRAPDDTATLEPGSDPLRIGRSNFLTFSPLGSATSGTVYLAGQTGPQMAVRILGATGRMRVLWFDSATSRWRED